MNAGASFCPSVSAPRSAEPLKDGRRARPNLTRSRQGAFSLIELLIVMAIIAVIATLGMPAIRGLTHPNTVTAAQRQIIDDLAIARFRALNNRSPVYMVFVPTNIAERIRGERDRNTLTLLTNLSRMQYSGYALLTRRSVGDQPGTEHPKFLTEWKQLPEGVVIAPHKFISGSSNEYWRSFDYAELPFPSTNDTFNLPCIGFNPQGQLISGRDEIIAVGRGSIMLLKQGNTEIADVVITPKDNFTNSYLRVSWLTGRSSVEKPVMP